MRQSKRKTARWIPRIARTPLLPTAPTTSVALFTRAIRWISPLKNWMTLMKKKSHQ
jgi:hypothetical protein